MPGLIRVSAMMRSRVKKGRGLYHTSRPPWRGAVPFSGLEKHQGEPVAGAALLAGGVGRRVPVARVIGVAHEVVGLLQLEARRLDLPLHVLLVDAVERVHV